MDPFAGRETLWVVHISHEEEAAFKAREEGFICIGWSELGDVSRFTTRESLREAMEQTWPEWKPRTISSCYGQVFRFAHEMDVGDPVVLPIRDTREIAIGRISGPYRFVPEFEEMDYANVRDVEWLAFVPRTAFSQAALHSFGAFLSVSTSDDYLDEVISVLNQDNGEIDVDAPQDEDAAVDLHDTALQETEDYLLKSWVRTGADFEHVVAATFEAMGYTATVTQATRDHGVDVIAHPDPLGLEAPYIKIQVKSGKTSVGEPDVNRLRGSLNPGEYGIIVALGGFASGAHHVARASAELRLLDSKQFVTLFLDHYDQLGPSWQARYPLKQVYVPTS